MAEGKENPSMLVECEDCKTKFEIFGNTSIVNHKKEFKIGDKSIFLTYYDCPKCGRRHFVQIDNDISLSKLNNVKNQFVRLASAKKKGKEILEEQSARFKGARKALSDYRMKLMRQYSNKFVCDIETNTTFELRFSV